MTIGVTHKRKPSIALIGMRGCGKSVVGRRLAHLLGGHCIDTDELVAQSAGKSISDIFKDEGEAGFRRREEEAVRQAAAAAPKVISVGGGAVLDEENLRKLRSVATIVWLTASVEVLYRRIAGDTATCTTRPPLTDRSGIDELAHLLAERSPFYEQAADLIIDTQRATPDEIAHAIIVKLNRRADDQ